ncbi:Flp pilus assembly protein, protease CpaA [Yoonia litorea]|uniref:Flp pilus assembly protein, protease CpaA n=2 Tax=Yoonia litorea TaxID=1123755 RepID=A0A1I6M9A6_9RHOB|nr:Flp pilus assembly protein, protease CpaA [Yoonia litorea]
MMAPELVNYAMAAVLIAAMLIELRTGRIPNWIAATPLLLFVVLAFITPDRTALYWQIGLAVAVFVGGLALFAVGGMGAGAVKLLGGTVLFVPLSKAFFTFLAFLAYFFICAFVVIQIRKLAGSEDSKWHVMAKQVIPLSLPIGLAGLTALFYL